MSSEDYKKLDKIKKFNFSFDMVTKSKAELQEQRDAVKDRRCTYSFLHTACNYFSCRIKEAS
jgi:hypothetical protein